MKSIESDCFIQGRVPEVFMSGMEGFFSQKWYTFVIMELPERIAAIIKVNQHTPASFADVLGVQRSSISHVLNGRNKPSMDFIVKILEHFPRVDAGWLITGKEPSQHANQNEIPKAQAATTKSSLTEKVNTPVSEKPSSNKRIERIVIFYSDRTFDTYEP